MNYREASLLSSYRLGMGYSQMISEGDYRWEQNFFKNIVIVF